MPMVFAPRGTSFLPVDAVRSLPRWPRRSWSGRLRVPERGLTNGPPSGGVTRCGHGRRAVPEEVSRSGVRQESLTTARLNRVRSRITRAGTASSTPTGSGAMVSQARHCGRRCLHIEARSVPWIDVTSPPSRSAGASTTITSGSAMTPTVHVARSRVASEAFAISSGVVSTTSACGRQVRRTPDRRQERDVANAPVLSGLGFGMSRRRHWRDNCGVVRLGDPQQ